MSDLAKVKIQKKSFNRADGTKVRAHSSTVSRRVTPAASSLRGPVAGPAEATKAADKIEAGVADLAERMRLDTVASAWLLKRFRKGKPVYASVNICFGSPHEEQIADAKAVLEGAEFAVHDSDETDDAAELHRAEATAREKLWRLEASPRNDSWPEGRPYVTVWGPGNEVLGGFSLEDNWPATGDDDYDRFVENGEEIDAALNGTTGASQFTFKNAGEEDGLETASIVRRYAITL